LYTEALAASTVKVAGRDVLGTWKVLISLGVAPVLYVFYAILATIVMTKANAPLKWRLWTPVVVMSALPCIGYAALKFGEAGMDVLKRVRCFTEIYAFVSFLSPGHCDLWLWP
jgi:glycerol-3-phosphate O-acyltransferase/dihydroxyacetone phosphate acyltransferase